jgi:KipI family sensor histidine kinase inhibitor
MPSSPDKTASTSSQPRILLCGDTGVSVEFGDRIDPAINRRVHCLARALRERSHPGIVDLIPSYRALLIQYDPWLISYENVVSSVEECSADYREDGSSAAGIIEIPVCYGGEWGPDLEDVAAHHGMTSEEVIAMHSRGLYTVYMIGFTPGFPYLGGLDERLATPRKKEPRRRVPAGSVGIADRQTGIYPVASPGGWQLIGWTPLEIFDLTRSDPFYLKPGDRLRFVAITKEECAGT